MVKRSCNATTEAGQPCQALPMKDDEYCFMHSPEHTQEVAEARRLGGLRRRREIAVSGAYDFVGIESVSDIRRIIEIAVLDTLGMDNSISRSRALGYLAQVAIKTLEVGEWEERLSVLEAAVGGHRLNGSVFDANDNSSRFLSEDVE